MVAGRCSLPTLLIVLQRGAERLQVPGIKGEDEFVLHNSDATRDGSDSPIVIRGEGRYRFAAKHMA